jgi:hypothetical protein
VIKISHKLFAKNVKTGCEFVLLIHPIFDFCKTHRQREKGPPSLLEGIK